MVVFSFALKQTQSAHIASDDTQISSSNKQVKLRGEINLNCTSFIGDARPVPLHGGGVFAMAS